MGHGRMWKITSSEAMGDSSEICGLEAYTELLEGKKTFRKASIISGG